MNIFHKKHIITMAIVALAFTHQSSIADPGIIVNAGVADSITAKELKRIFLGKTTVWKNGLPVRPCFLDKEPAASSFFSTAVKRSRTKYDAYWNKKIFSGDGIKPASFDSEKSVADFASNNKGAICFSDTSVVGTAKLMSIQ